jgi:hypothetical protein
MAALRGREVPELPDDLGQARVKAIENVGGQILDQRRPNCR